MSGRQKIVKLRAAARQLRLDLLRYVGGKRAYVGGALSSIEIVTALFFDVMKDAEGVLVDDFILSKGHVSPLLHTALVQVGKIPRAEFDNVIETKGWLDEVYKDTDLMGLARTCQEPGLGLSFAVGTAFAKVLKNDDSHTFCLVGDGECGAGLLWEAVMHAGAKRAEGVTAIVDFNRLQASGAVDEVMPLDPLSFKWEAFGWAIREIDGNDMQQVHEALHWARKYRGQPTVIIAHTIKGKGVSFLENEPGSHVVTLSKEQVERARGELLKGENE